MCMCVDIVYTSCGSVEEWVFSDNYIRKIIGY